MVPRSLPKACAGSRIFTRSKAKIRDKTPDQRLDVRQKQSAPLIADFSQWLTKQPSVVRENDLTDRFLILTTIAKSPLGRKPSSIHRHWEGLQIFLTDGCVEMDVNPGENTIGPVTLQEGALRPPFGILAMPKPYRATGHAEGGHTGARIASLIKTCKINSIAPYACLRRTREAITSGHPKPQTDDPMPWAFTKTSSR